MKFLNILLFLILSFNINAQNLTNEHFSAYGTTSGISLVSGNTYNFTITGFAGSSRPYGNPSYSRADVVVGDKIYLGCNQYTIATITSIAPNLAGTLTKIDNATLAPTNFQKVAIIREYIAPNGLITYSLPPYGDGNAGAIAGIDISLASCIKAHYATKDSINLSVAINNAIDITKYSGNGIPVFTPTTSEPKLAQGLSSPFPLYKWNGTSWIEQISLTIYGTFRNPIDAATITPFNGLWETAFNNEMGQPEGVTIRRKN
jgi:hypothetical protein